MRGGLGVLLHRFFGWSWIPAFAGMTWDLMHCPYPFSLIPAKAGIQSRQWEGVSAHLLNPSR